MGDEGFDRGTYGRSFADVYDDWYGDASDAEATAAFLARFGSALDVLELGSGTGRLATAISAAGNRVAAVEISPEMLAENKAPTAVRADMANLPVATSSVDVVLIATNTLFNLDSPAAQTSCIADVARVLRPAGHVVIEAYVPPGPDPGLDRLVSTRSVEAHRVVLTASIRDSAAQVITGQHIDITESGVRLRPWRVRYADPSEIDAMAGAAALEPVARLSDWAGGAYDDTSTGHVSVYRRPGP